MSGSRNVGSLSLEEGKDIIGWVKTLLGETPLIRVGRINLGYWWPTFWEWLYKAFLLALSALVQSHMMLLDPILPILSCN